MKRNKTRELVREVLEARDDFVAPEVVTFRTISIDFERRTVTFDGQSTTFDTAAVDFPILSGDVVIMPRRGR